MPKQPWIEFVPTEGLGLATPDALDLLDGLLRCVFPHAPKPGRLLHRMVCSLF